MFDPYGWNGEDPADRLGEALVGLIKEEIGPTEYLLWADRPASPRPIRIPAMPMLFVSAMAGLSGLALAGIFGLANQAWLDPRLVALAMGLAPAVLGGLIILHLLGRGVRMLLRRRWLSRLVYAVTDQRAIVGRIDAPAGDRLTHSLWRGTVADTRRFENPDGSGDLFFLGHGREDWLPLDFQEVPSVGLVESLARETLIDEPAEGWQADDD
ncbi:hypothetical protein OJF2_23910 [Aquisphaera giovannonii]|uniref:Uncharacterized protein n=1 Tax=Aquisphaera giovannonii TaxID=406548 RepID=A0A5B9W1K8_9BACT|nr:hypothetical protein [Aquisphaera giovannonii]QEH33860.1 hypothetical protein OJF2_23910 [Aquisphaera giovannonii]